jgi:hypothetical protein
MTSPRPDLASSVKSEPVDGQKKTKSMPLTEKSEKSASSPAASGKKVVASHPAVGRDSPTSSSSAPARKTAVPVSPAVLSTRKGGTAPSPTLQEGITGGKKQQQPPPLSGKAQEKAAAGETAKAQKMTKSPASESKKSANHTFVKPSPKTSLAAKSHAGKSAGVAASKSNKSAAVKSPQGKAAQKSAAVAAAQPLTVNLRAKKDAKERAVCMVCDVGNRRNEKLIFCKNCDKIGKGLIGIFYYCLLVSCKAFYIFGLVGYIHRCVSLIENLAALIITGTR